MASAFLPPLASSTSPTIPRTSLGFAIVCSMWATAPARCNVCVSNLHLRTGTPLCVRPISEPLRHSHTSKANHKAKTLNHTNATDPQTIWWWLWWCVASKLFRPPTLTIFSSFSLDSLRSFFPEQLPSSRIPSNVFGAKVRPHRFS